MLRALERIPPAKINVSPRFLNRIRSCRLCVSYKIEDPHSSCFRESVNIEEFLVHPSSIQSNDERYHDAAFLITEMLSYMIWFEKFPSNLVVHYIFLSVGNIIFVKESFQRLAPSTVLLCIDSNIQSSGLHHSKGVQLISALLVRVEITKYQGISRK